MPKKSTKKAIHATRFDPDAAIAHMLSNVDKFELFVLENLYDHIKRGTAAGLTAAEVNQWKMAQMNEYDKFRHFMKKNVQNFSENLRKEAETCLLQSYMDSKEKAIAAAAKKYRKAPKYAELIEEAERNPQAFQQFHMPRFLATLDAISKDFEEASFSLFRVFDDIYRQTIQGAAEAFAGGSVTIYEAIDQAQNDFLKNGVRGITYRNGATHSLRSYTEMALRTNERRAAITAEAHTREWLGIRTVLVSHHGITCSMCGPWQGKVLIDDVYMDYTPSGPQPYPLLSSAIDAGLLHPNCRHRLMTFDPEIDEIPEPYRYTDEDLERYEAQQEQRAIENEIRKKTQKLMAAQSDAERTKARKQLLHQQERMEDLLSSERGAHLIRQPQREEI